eukprot:gene2225-2399_t
MKGFSLNLNKVNEKKEETPVGGMKLNLTSVSSNTNETEEKKEEKKFSLDFGKIKRKDTPPPQKSPLSSVTSSPATSERTNGTPSTTERTNQEEQIVFVPKISMSNMKPIKFSEKTPKSTDKKKIHLDLLFTDLCPDFEIEEELTNENIKPYIDKIWFGNEKKETEFEFFELTKLNSDEDEETYHLACRPTNQDFSVKLLKSVLYQNKMLKIKLEKSSEAIRTFSNEKIQDTDVPTDVIALLKHPVN